MYYVVVAGKPDDDGAFATTADAWTHIAVTVEDYADVLAGDDALITHWAQWDELRNEARARALAPWPSTGVIEGPDGNWWGVNEKKGWMR